MARVLLIACVVLSGIGCNRTPPADSDADARPPATDRPRHLGSLAVLPFAGRYDPPEAVGDETEWGRKIKQLNKEILPDEISNRFATKAKPESLKLIPASVVRSRPAESGKGGAESPQAVGKRFGVDTVLATTVGSKGQLSAQLLDVSTGELLWGKTYQLVFKGNFLHWAVDFPDIEEEDIVDNVVRTLSERRGAK